MDLYRFYVPDLTQQIRSRTGEANRVILTDEESHHARSVLRLVEGQNVLLFDGKGASVVGRISPVKGRASSQEVAISEPVYIDPPPSRHLTLATAIPKGDRADWLVEQASQLYVSSIQWLASDRGVVKPREGGHKLEKWGRLAIESAKQCGRHYLMHVQAPRSLKTVLNAPQKDPPHLIFWLDPRATQSLPQVMADLDSQSSPQNVAITALIGPEGGWSDAERTMLEQMVQEQRIHPVRLTSTILRIETACAAVAAVVMSGP